MFTIGIRTIKTAIGVMIAFSIAQFFSLENASTAAVIMLLSVQSTKRQSIIVALKRFTAGISGIILAAIIFEGTRYTPLAIGLLICIYIPMMAKYKLQDGIVPGFVIIMQIYVKGGLTVDFMLNQIYIIVIGIMVALFLNLYMPSTEGKLKEMARSTENNMKQLLIQMSRFIKKKEPVWNDLYELKVEECIQSGLDIAKRNIENTFFQKETYYDSYFKMRAEQNEILKRVVPMILHLPGTFPQSKMVANFVEKIGVALDENNSAIDLLEDIRELKTTFEKMELPKTRDEFEVRAALLIFINEIEKFIKIKIDFIRK